MWKVPEPHDEWIDAFLTVGPPTDVPVQWFSTFSAVVRDARQATGRNMHTGEVADELSASNWLGAMGYLVMLDQVGECFRPVPVPRDPPHEGAIPRALTYFQPALQDDEILAIYALRCAFTHDYGLVNVGRGRAAARLHHRFELVAGRTTPLVQLPAVSWNGDLSGAVRRNPTRVNLRRLGDLAEQVVGSLRRASADRRLVVALNGGIDELFTRFTVMTWPE
jgi:hypothetical protein